MILTKLNENLNNISNLPDKPSIQADELKAVFDKAGNTIKDYINETLTEEVQTLNKNTKNEIIQYTDEQMLKYDEIETW